jgi:hypothetical protein
MYFVVRVATDYHHVHQQFSAKAFICQVVNAQRLFRFKRARRAVFAPIVTEPLPLILECSLLECLPVQGLQILIVFVHGETERVYRRGAIRVS